MRNPEFIPGQRWISSTEPGLGMGIVVEYENNRIEITFPAVAERRSYSAANAPLSRIRYQVGDKILDTNELSYTVSEVTETDGIIVYECLDSKGMNKTLPEMELNSFVHFSSPKDRLFAGQVDKLSHFKLRQQTLALQGELDQSSVRGLLGGRIQLLPHQLYIADEVAGRHAPRVLLADEVGLGKTIEAGLIIHQQIIKGQAERVLIVVPDSLVHQWLVEMMRRFNLYFTILDKERCEALSESDDTNPFETAQLVISSLSLFTENEQLHQQALKANWDLMVVDEAHHLEWSPDEKSVAYERVETLSEKALGLLLLTATPEQLGVDSHFARLRLLDPDRYYDIEKFRAEESDYEPVNTLIQKLLDDDGTTSLVENKDLQTKLAGYLGEERVEALLNSLHQGTTSEPELASNKQEITLAVRELADHHGTGRVLFRNTRHNIKGFPERELQLHALGSPEFYSTVQENSNLDHLLHPELIAGEGWTANDPRVVWLSDWLKQRRSEKALIICAYAETALDLEEFLNLKMGVRSAVFHEGMSLVERDRAGAYFADNEDGAQVLVCSEIGSEGRNFQFAHHLVLFDLPLNPDLLEQRIGRLDRIGQRNTVQIHVPYYEDTPQAGLLKWYRDGLNAFQSPFPAGQNVYEEFGDRLVQALESFKGSTGFQTLVDETARFSKSILISLSQGRDPLLELNSCDQPKAEEMVKAIAEWDDNDNLAEYMASVFSQFGVDHEPHSEHTEVIHPSNHMLYHHFPGLPDEGLTATYDRDRALSRDDIHYLTWEHPMVSGAMDMILSGEFGNSTLCTIKLPPLKPGTMLMEAVFTLHCPAPKHMQIQRFLPIHHLRVFLDANGTDLSQVINIDQLNQLSTKVPKRNAQELIRHARPQIEDLVKKAEQKVYPQQDSLIEKAVAKMRTLQENELKRMQKLAKVNPNIRQEEIQHIEKATAELEKYLQGAQIRLDGLRLVIAT